MSVTIPLPAITAASLRELRRNSPAARGIVRAWRGFVGAGRRPPTTVVACSGGADSCALALALAGATSRLVIAHIVHDMRERSEALADRDSVRDFAERLALPFAESQVTVGAGNAEAGARRERYRALARIARAHSAAFVATAHHADDQLESMVMALLRGAGPAGLRGVAPSRILTRHVTLIRPMLATTRAQAQDLCSMAGVAWREDATNSDGARFRAALRHGPLAALSALRPQGALRASRSSALLRDAAALVEQRASQVFGEETSWSRRELQQELSAVLGHGLRRAAIRLIGASRADRLGGRVVDPVVLAIRDAATHPRSFDWPGGLRVEVTSRTVALRPAPK